LPQGSHSKYISSKLDCNYERLSNLFAEVKGIDIKKFIVVNKIERAKELLLYGNLNLTEISYQLQYSSVAHLSNQFKETTGLSPSYFKKMNTRRRKNMQKVGIV
jgi:AraC-like DNA-binding protein